MAEKHLHDDRGEILATDTPSREDFQRRFAVAAVQRASVQDNAGRRIYDFLSKT